MGPAATRGIDANRFSVAACQEGSVTDLGRFFAPCRKIQNQSCHSKFLAIDVQSRPNVPETKANKRTVVLRHDNGRNLQLSQRYYHNTLHRKILGQVRPLGSLERIHTRRQLTAAICHDQRPYATTKPPATLAHKFIFQ